MKALTLSLDFPPPRELEANTNYHWAARHKKVEAVQDAVIALLLEQGDYPRFTTPVDITYRLYWCGQRADRDNVAYRMKTCLDALVARDVIEDDSPDEIASIQVEYVRVPHRKDVKTEIIVREALLNAHQDRH